MKCKTNISLGVSDLQPNLLASYVIERWMSERQLVTESYKNTSHTISQHQSQESCHWLLYLGLELDPS